MIPGALMKIAFDRFHVAKHLGDAVDKVRRAEHRALVKEATGSWQAQVAVAEGGQTEDACREAGVRKAPCGHPPDCPGLGVEGSGRKPMELSKQDLGAGRMEQVAGVGIGLRSGACPEDRPDDPGASLGHRQRDHPPAPTDRRKASTAGSRP